MIRAVLDANVLVSGIAGYRQPTSTPGSLLRAWQAGSYELAISAHILAETTRAVSRPYFLRTMTPSQISQAIALLSAKAVLCTIGAVVQGVATHPEDDLVLATAVSAHADYLVTGDRQLQALGIYEGVRIVSPSAFLATLAEADVD